MNIFLAASAVVGVMLLMFVLYAFLTNTPTSSPASAQKKRIDNSGMIINSSVNDSSENSSDNLP